MSLHFNQKDDANLAYFMMQFGRKYDFSVAEWDFLMIGMWENGEILAKSYNK